MELDRKVRWKNLRDELFGVITSGAHSPDDIVERVKAYKGGLYESPKEYVDGYAINDGSWVKYYYNGRFRCKNKDEIGRYLFGYVCFLMEAGIDDGDEFWYYSLCFLIDRLEYREGLFGCSLENKGRIESTIRIARAKKPQEVWTAKKDERGFCLDPQLIKGISVGEKTRMQKKYMKKATDERIRRIYDPSSKKSVQDNATICGVSKGRMEQWLQEFYPKN